VADRYVGVGHISHATVTTTDRVGNSVRDPFGWYTSFWILFPGAGLCRVLLAALAPHRRSLGMKYVVVRAALNFLAALIVGECIVMAISF